MSAILFGLMTLLLILVSGFLVLIILMQRASSNSGMGSALGGGAAESALGAGAGNMLTKSTIIGSVAFFVLSFGLYLALLASAEDRGPSNTLPVEEMSPAGEETESTEAPGAKPLMNLPEGLESTNVRQQLENQGATTTTVNSEQGSMIITEDAIKVEPATAENAEQVDATEADSAPADEANKATEESSAPESSSTETESAPAEESSETTEPAETNAQ